MLRANVMMWRVAIIFGTLLAMPLATIQQSLGQDNSAPRSNSNLPAPELPETVIEAQRQPQQPSSPSSDFSSLPDRFPEPLFGRSVDLTGQTSAASEGVFGAADLQFRPMLRAGEVLELVPGMIATQHSGTGKANQFFVRGFNLDHGTDFAMRVDGVPINLPSHAHGQGYLDINWLIPELIERANYKLGPYYADVGDFSSAGSVDVQLARRLPQGIASFSAGSFDYYRLLVANSHSVAGGDLLYAYEQNFYDGPWSTPQDYNKFNGLLKWTIGDDDEGLSLSAMAFRSYWNATNQISQRAFNAGLVDRFGTLDPSDGGETSRIGVNAEYWLHDGIALTKANAFVAAYDLSLFSNFTYFLDDPVNGDQIHQMDRRVTTGVNLSRHWDLEITKHTIGFQFRNDNISKLGLNHTTQQQFLATVRSDDVQQQNYGVFYANDTQLTDTIRANVGLRGDFFHFDVTSHTNPADTNDVSAAVFSPKTGLVFGPWNGNEMFLNWGQSFHSNDARGIAAAADPASPLVKSDGSEIGMRSWITPDWNSSVSLWYLELDSELVFAGDAGTNEPAGASHRTGVTWTNHWDVRDWLTVDADYAYVRPRLIGGERIPNSVSNVVSAGFSAHQPEGGWYATLRLRHFGPGPLIEDNSARASTTTLVNMQIGYQHDRFRMAVDFLNVLNRRDNDILYFYDSQPLGLPPAADYHFHPIEPFMMRGHITWNF